MTIKFTGIKFVLHTQTPLDKVELGPHDWQFERSDSKHNRQIVWVQFGHLLGYGHSNVTGKGHEAGA